MLCRSRPRLPTAAWSINLDTATAEKMPGVRAIFHRENIGKMFRSTPDQDFAGTCEERRPTLEDDVVRYYGQYVALAVADTFETARGAADAVRVTYAKDRPNVDTDLKVEDEPEVVATTFGPYQRLQREPEADVLHTLVRLPLRRGHVAAGDRPAARQPGGDGHRCGPHY